MIPAELKNKDQWIVWTSRNRKVPYAPWTKNSDPVDPLKSENWTSFERAVQFVKHRDYDGLGFAFTAEDDIVGIDLDDCVKDISIKGNNVSVRLTSRHQDIVDSLDSFTEISQSGNGIHVFVRGDVGGQVTDNDKDVEIYDRDRFFCMTGKVVTDYSMSVEDRSDKLNDLKQAYMSELDGGEKQNSSTTYSTGDFEVEKFKPNSDSQFDQLSIVDVFPDLDIPCKTAHPIHGSSTGKNFLVDDEDGYVCTCFRGNCSYGSSAGCVLLPQHLIAMKMKGWEQCSRVREEWDLDMRIEAWKYAVKNLGVNPLEVPLSIKAGLSNRYDVDVFAGGRTSVSVSNFLERKLREEHGVDWL